MQRVDRPSPDINAVEDVFDQSVGSYSAQIEASFGPFPASHDFFMRHKAKLIRDFLETKLPNRRVRVLDVGCGMGLIHPYLYDEAIELHGVDISRKSLEFAATRNPGVNYHHHDGNQLPFGSGEFDLTLATCVFHHVPVSLRDGLIAEMVRVTRPGRFVMVIEHNPLNPATRWVVHNCDLDRDAVLLTPWTLKKLFRGSGLSAITTRHILFTPFKASFFRRLEQWLSHVPLGAQYVIEATKPDVANR